MFLCTCISLPTKMNYYEYLTRRVIFLNISKWVACAKCRYLVWLHESLFIKNTYYSENEITYIYEMFNFVFQCVPPSLTKMETFAQNVVSASIMNLAEEVMVPVLMDARLAICLIYAKVVKFYIWNMTRTF